MTRGIVEAIYDRRCQKCKTRVTYVRIRKRQLVCRSCGYISMLLRLK